MAIIFVDSCDKYNASADLTKFWTSVNTSDNIYDASKGRYGGGCIIVYDDIFNMWKNFPVAGTAPSTDELFVSFWFYPEAMPTNEEGLITFQNAEGGYTFTMNITPSGVLNLRRGGATSTIMDASAVTTIVSQAWHRVELRIVVDNLAGLYELRVNGSAVIGPTTGVNTRGSSSSSGVSQLVLSGNNNSVSGFIFDDIIVNDSSGSTFNTFPGQVRIDAIRPTGAGDSSDGVASGAATLHAAVDEAGTYDGDATYAGLSAPGDKNLFVASDLSETAASVLGVVVSAVAKATGGPRTIRTKVKHGTSEGDGATRLVPAGTYGYIQDAFPINPSTGSTWTDAEINAMQIGYEVVD